jgi:hypothetical protein
MRYRLFVALAFVVLCSGVRSQELKCDVIVNLESIPSSARDNLRDFESNVERYLNNTRFTDEDMLGDKIECTINIFIKSASPDFRYQAQVFVGSQRPVYDENRRTTKVSPLLRILDERIDFSYVTGQRLIQDELTFDSLADLLDYYAYTIIAFDFETYTPRSGDRYFQKALNICIIAQSSSYASAWQQTSASYSRFGFSDELNKGSYDAFRSAFTEYHFDGLDMLSIKKELAWRTILSAVENISRIRQRQTASSVLIKQFFDVKFKEIAEVFSDYPDKDVYDRISTFDPEHRSAYQEYKAKRP